MEIHRRYVLEPRCSYMSRGNRNKFWYSRKCWIVVYDTQSEKYLEEGPHHKYMRFKSSKEAFDYLITL